MDRDPHDLTDQDIDAIVLHMRKAKRAYDTGNLSAGNTKPKASAKTEKAKAKTETANKLTQGIDLSKLL